MTTAPSLDILLVDDAPTVVATPRGDPPPAGGSPQNVDAATDGHRALELFRVRDYDVVFLDLVMPRVAGDAFGPLMMAERPETKFVVVTGLDPDDDRVRDMVARGAVDVIEKPIRFEDVGEALAVVGSLWTPQAETAEASVARGAASDAQ